MKINSPTPVSEITDPVFTKACIKLYIKREDLLHPIVSGNKWRKLKYNLEAARKAGFKTLLTFGGAYSNHIMATSFAAGEEGYQSIGIIRGEKTTPLNPTLRKAQDHGMQLHFISREEYAKKNEGEFLKRLKSEFGDFYLIPEGGSNKLGVKGVMELGKELTDYTHICVPVGTGTTLAGIIQSMNDSQFALGVAVLKGKGYLESLVQELMNDRRTSNWEINHNFHFGGYAKFNSELIDFINDFHRQHRILLDPVYTGKMMFGVLRLSVEGYFPKGSRVVVIHTGGLQGIEGFNKRFGSLIRTD